MTDMVSDGGTDSRTGAGRTTLANLAPDAARAFEKLVSIRPSGVHDEVLESPAVRALAEQLRTDVSAVTDEMRAAFDSATGAHQMAVVQMVWIGDQAPRLRAGVDALFGSSQWPTPRRYPVADVWGVIEEYTQAVARLTTLDAVTTELVRLRGARLHDNRLASSRRSVRAIEAGADDAMFEAVDHHDDSRLDAAAQAALALTDAMTRTPTEVSGDVVARVREHFTDEQAVELLLDVVRNATDKIAVALRVDAADVSEGVQLFVTDDDGAISTV